MMMLRLCCRRVCLWFSLCALLIGLLYWGKVAGPEEEIVFREFAPRLWKESWRTLVLIFPALLATLSLALVIGAVEWLGRASLRARAAAKRRGHNARCWLYAVPGAMAYLTSGVVSFCAAVPPFLIGIFLIRLAHLDTVRGDNLGYGILCLALFNVDYFFRRSRQIIEEAYVSPHVLFARSLGLPERAIFRHHILPRIVRDNLALVRELLPHLAVESIVIEITFSYNGLLHSAVQAMRYPNPAGWCYLAFGFGFFVLLLALAGHACRLAEDAVCPPETVGK